MPDITPSKFRSTANGIINLMGGLGTIIASLVGSTLYEINVNFPFWMGSILVVLAAALVFIFIKEPKTYEAAEKEPNMFASLKELGQSKDKSGLRILFAIFFWFLAYSGIESFLTLYATKSLGLSAGDAGRLTGHMGILFVLFAILAGIIGTKIGRRTTISIGIVGMTTLIVLIAALPASFLTQYIAKIPVLGTIRVLNLFLMGAGITLGIHQHQFAADGRGSHHCLAPGHIHRAVLPVFDFCQHRWPQPQWLDRANQQWKLQQRHVRRASFPGHRADLDVRRQER